MYLTADNDSHDQALDIDFSLKVGTTSLKESEGQQVKLAKLPRYLV